MFVEIQIEQLLYLLVLGQIEEDKLVDPAQQGFIELLRQIGGEHEKDFGAGSACAIEESVDDVSESFADWFSLSVSEQSLGLINEYYHAVFGVFRKIEQFVQLLHPLHSTTAYVPSHANRVFHLAHLRQLLREKSLPCPRRTVEYYVPQSTSILFAFCYAFAY